MSAYEPFNPQGTQGAGDSYRPASDSFNLRAKRFSMVDGGGLLLRHANGVLRSLGAYYLARELTRAR